MSTDHYQTLLESIAQVTWRARPDGWAVDLESWCRFTGMSLEEAQGWGWVESVHPEDRERTERVWSRAIEAGTTYQVDYRIRRHDGVYRWFSVHGAPIRGQAGEVSEWFGACIDIHDRVAAQERLTSVLDNMSEAFISIDRDWVITYQNREGARINEKPPEAIYGKRLQEEWPEVPDGPLEWNYRKALAEGRPVRFQHRYYDPGKYDVWLEIQAVPSDDGGLGIFYLDISERKRAELALLESEKRFRQLADHLQAAFLITDQNVEAVFYASTFVETLFGVTPEAFTADPATLLAAVHPGDRERVIQEVLADPAAAEQADYRIVSPAGEVRWISHRLTPIPATDDEPARIAHILTDVTDQRSLEHQLQQAQRMESLGRLAGGVAHDFNNIMTVILGAVSFLQEQISEESHAADLAQIEAAAERASKITRQILAFARRQESAPVPLDLNRVVERSRGLLRGILRDDVELVALLEEGVPTVHLDPAQLDQLLVNLAANASQAMPDGGRFVLKTDRITDPAVLGDDFSGIPPGEYALLSVADTGVGIPEEIQKRIFDPFFTTREDAGGTGLGLATCYGIVSQAEGHIRVRSRPAEGTEFLVFLPAHDASAPGATLDSAEVVAGGRETILLAEDEAPVRALARRALERLGYRVLVAENGVEALEILTREPEVDLLVTDMVMPGMTGSALAQAVSERRPDLPVLAVSGYRSGEGVPESVVPAELAFLPKPYTPRGLARRVREVLDSVGSRGGGGAGPGREV